MLDEIKLEIAKLSFELNSQFARLNVKMDRIEDKLVRQNSTLDRLVFVSRKVVK